MAARVTAGAPTGREGDSTAVISASNGGASALAEEATASAFELKAAGFTLPVIRLLSTDMDRIDAELAPKVRQAPGFFQNAPVVVDLGALDGADADPQLPTLVGLLRGAGMIPVGVRGGSTLQHQAAKAMELAVLHAEAKPRPKPGAGGETQAAPPLTRQGGEAQAGVETGSTLIDRPVRSGQRVYAVGGDLTVVAPVNSGAELMADGNIHVYGRLHGRVMAGVGGDRNARIFCSDLHAELISVAGHYRVSDSIPGDLKGRRVQVFLDHDRIRIEPL